MRVVAFRAAVSASAGTTRSGGANSSPVDAAGLTSLRAAVGALGGADGLLGAAGSPLADFCGWLLSPWVALVGRFFEGSREPAPDGFEEPPAAADLVVTMVVLGQADNEKAKKKGFRQWKGAMVKGVCAL